MVVRNVDDDVRNVKRNCKVLIPFKKCVTDIVTCDYKVRKGHSRCRTVKGAEPSGVTPVIASSLRSSM